MKICVCGWYKDEQFYETLHAVSKDYNIVIVSHKPGGLYLGLPFVEIPNIGLEWGAYNYYLMQIWDGASNVLFTHDDTKVSDLGVFDRIATLPHDVAYIFRDRSEERANAGKHGRAVFMSARFLRLVKDTRCDCREAKGYIDKHHHIGQQLKGTGAHRGFWFDPENTGHNSGKPPLGVRHYNAAIYHFHWYLGRVRDRKLNNESMDVVNRVYFPEYECGRRGTWRHKEAEQKKYALA